MFELEVGTTTLPAGLLPADVMSAFERTAERVAAFSLTPWEEHCTECAMPACYVTCDLYEARKDGKCRRFVQGIETIPAPNHPQGYVARVAFKRWGCLLAYTDARPVSIGEAVQIERRVRRAERFAAGLPGASIAIAGRRGIASRMVRRWKQRMRTSSGGSVSGAPDCLVLEIHNPNARAVRLSLSVQNPGRPPYQQLVELTPGYHFVQVAIDAIRTRVDLEQPIHVTLNPNILEASEEGLTLFFGLLAFARMNGAAAGAADTVVAAQKSSGKAKAVKVAVWDLDNTVWNGTLVEDGLAGVRLRDEAVRLIREFDRRGIVNSVLSKNSPEDGLAALRHFGIEELFVFPKIGWREKGSVMKQLVREFNVDANTFAFIDDQEFERAQVVATNPSVRAYDSADLLPLLDLPEFNPPQSAESASRRQFYRAEEHRVKDLESFGGEYMTFLRSTAMRATIEHPREATIDRVQELVQRTNQLNYSGTHYTRDEIDALLADPALEAYTIACTDNYGEYGTVGFVLVNRETRLLRDAMFSCRIQFKRVEHAVLAFLLHRYASMGATHFDARFNETKKNGPAASVFPEVGFDLISQEGSARLYRFDLSRPIPDDRIVTIRYEGAAWAR